MAEHLTPDSTPYVTTTRGILIAVKPEFSEQNSNPAAGVYVYTYTITITNQGKEDVQLVSRKWVIQDGFNRTENVVGDGVVGQQPTLKPGESFTYSSFCPLATPTGSMRGTYQMKNDRQETFDAVIGEFHLMNKNLVN